MQDRQHHQALKVDSLQGGKVLKVQAKRARVWNAWTRHATGQQAFEAKGRNIWWMGGTWGTFD